MQFVDLMVAQKASEGKIKDFINSKNSICKFSVVIEIKVHTKYTQAAVSCFCFVLFFVLFSFVLFVVNEAYRMHYKPIMIKINPCPTKVFFTTYLTTKGGSL